MKLDSYRRARPVINVSALVDVLFILLIFVMLAANFDPMRALRVTLPSGQSNDAPSDAAILEVAVSGPMALDGQPVTLAELDDRLRQVRARRETLIVAADGHIPLTRVTALLSAANRAGFASVAIATRDRDPGASEP